MFGTGEEIMPCRFLLPEESGKVGMRQCCEARNRPATKSAWQRKENHGQAGHVFLFVLPGVSTGDRYPGRLSTVQKQHDPDPDPEFPFCRFIIPYLDAAPST